MILDILKFIDKKYDKYYSKDEFRQKTNYEKKKD